MSNDITLITKSDYSLVKEPSLNERQVDWILKKTPESAIETRPGKGGLRWKYVKGSYIIKVLNLMFGFDWDFEIVDQWAEGGEAIVKGKLTCRNAEGKAITKTDFGNKEIICKRGTDKPLSLGNDYKAAATDCLKRCARQIGIAQDVYNPDDFKEVRVDLTSERKDKLTELERFVNFVKECTSKEELLTVVDIRDEIGDVAVAIFEMKEKELS